MNIKFSIIIPVFNAEKFVGAAIESCLNQTWRDIEIVCIDDFSTDSSREILRAFAERDARIKCVCHEKNKSQFIARRTGFEHSSGDYVLYLDSDDTLKPDACSVVAKQIRKTGADVVQFAFTEMPAGNYVFRCFSRTSKERIARYLARENRCSPQVWDKAYKRSVMEKSYGAMDNFYASGPEDLYTSIVFAHYAASFDFVKKPLLGYSTGTGWSVRRVHSLDVYKSWLVSYKNVIDHIKIFINKNIPEFNAKCFDMEVYLMRDFLFERIPRDLPVIEKFRFYEMLHDYFSNDVTAAFLHDMAEKSRAYDKYLSFSGPFSVRLKKCIKTMLLCIKLLLSKSSLS